MIDAPRASREPNGTYGGDAPAHRLLALNPLRAKSVTPLHHPVPWRLAARGTDLVLWLEALHEEHPADPANRELFLACGAALENLHIVATRHEFALSRLSGREDDPTLIARLEVTPLPDGGGAAAPRQEIASLYRILDRVDPEAPSPAASAGASSPALLALLRHAARRDGICLDVVTERDRRARLAGMVRAGASAWSGGRAARRILFGVGGDFGGTSPLAMARGGDSHLGELLAALGARVALHDEWHDEPSNVARDGILDATMVGVLSSRRDTPADWIAAGGALQRVLLHASVQGLCIRIRDEPVRTPLLRDELQGLVGGPCVPQAVVLFTFDHAVELEMHAAARGARAIQ